jgi:class 3 adenylate cyclase/lipopolysaccharide biosynthesis regulator YciM
MQAPLPRKLAAIMYADVAGYSRLTGEDEDATHRTLGDYLDLIESTIGSHRGEVMHYAGDAVLAKFESVGNALSGAADIQTQLAERNAALPDDRKVHFRIGINLGDVIEDRGDIYGDGVNIAARLESLAQPGGICISDTVRSAMGKKLKFDIEDMGEQALKNIEQPVHAFKVIFRKSVQGKSDAVTSATNTAALEFSPPEPPTVAIMPFKSLGSDPDKDYLADGIRYGIQASLTQLSGLFLVHSPVLNTYRDKDYTAASVGKDLDARYVLEGAVQQAGKNLRATLQLIDVDTSQAIWAERYDRVVEDVFALQDEIAREVISSLHIKLVESETGRIWFSKLTSPEAKEFYYRGASHLYAGTKEDNAAARQMFAELYRVEPDSVIGPSNISATHWIDAAHGWTESRKDSYDQARQWAKKAMTYEDNNGIGHAVYGHLQLMDGKHDEALATCAKGVQLRASCPLAHGLLGLVRNYCGDSRTAIKSIRNALELEKVYPPWLIDILAAAYRDCSEIELSISAARESVRLNPLNIDARLVLCSDYKIAADDDNARSTAEEILRNDPEFRVSTYARSQPYKSPEPLERVVTALREAGLPD